MFEKDLQDRLQRIFDFKKTRFDDPGESLEQQCLFINVESAQCSVKDKLSRALVRGQIFVFATFDELPYGYFEKRINRAQAADVSRFFFHKMDENRPVSNNIVRRSVDFVFFFETQYDPRVGIIDQVTFQEVES